MKIKVSKTSKKGSSFRCYLPKEVGERYEGEVQCLDAGSILVLIRPGASREDVDKGLHFARQWSGVREVLST